MKRTVMMQSGLRTSRLLLIGLALIVIQAQAAPTVMMRLQAWHRQYPVVVSLLGRLKSCHQVRALSSRVLTEARGMDNLMLRLRQARPGSRSRRSLRRLFIRQRQRLLGIVNRLSRIQCVVPGNKAVGFRMQQSLRNLTGLFRNMSRVASDAIRTLR
jgi:hypothetical protein